MKKFFMNCLSSIIGRTFLKGQKSPIDMSNNSGSQQINKVEANYGGNITVNQGGKISVGTVKHRD